MRIFVSIVVMVATSALVVGAGVLLVLTTPDPGSWLWLGSVAMLGALITPVCWGSVLAFWGVGRSEGARRTYRRGLIATIGVQVLAIILLFLYIVLTAAPWWIAAACTGVSAVLTVGATVLGPRLQRMDVDRPPNSRIAAYSRDDLRRDLRRILGTALATLVATAVAIGVLVTVLGANDTGGIFVFAPVFAAMAGGIVCVFVTRRLAREIRGLVGGDLERARLIGRVVVRGKSTSLAPEDDAAAPRFAALSTVAQVYQIAWLGCLYLALVTQQIMRLVDDPGDLLSWSALILFAVTIVAVGPVTVIQFRRTRRYALEHGETILEPRESTAVPAA